MASDLSEIFAADYVRATGRLRNEADVIRGSARALNALTAAYHATFGRSCDAPAFGPFVELTETVTKTYDDPTLDRLYGNDTTYVTRVREQYYQTFRTARDRIGLFDLVQNMEFLASLGTDAEKLIQENGCGSADLRRFEENLRTATDMANRQQ